MRRFISLVEGVLADEKFWVDASKGEIELVHDHDEYGSIRDAIGDGYVQGEYSNESNSFSLVAKDVRTLCLAVRALITNHSSIRGITYKLLTGEEGEMDYADMMQFRQSARLPLQEGLSANWNDLVNRGLEIFDREMPEMQKRLAYGSRYKKYTIVIPMGPRHEQSSLMGDDAVVNVTFWKFGEKPKSLDNLGGWANRDSRKGQWGNYRIEMVWSHDIRDTRRVLAHELTHIPQQEKNDWVGLTGDQTNYEYRMWANEKGEEPLEKRFARMHTLHHEYPAEQEAELVALFTMLRDGDVEYACESLVDKVGRYMRFSKKDFLKKAVSFGVTPQQIHDLNTLVRRVLQNCMAMTERTTERNQSVSALQGVMMIANYCQMMGIDYTDVVESALKNGLADFEERSAKAAEKGEGQMVRFLDKARAIFVKHAKVLLAGRLPRFYFHHSTNNHVLNHDVRFQLLKGIDNNEE